MRRTIGTVLVALAIGISTLLVSAPAHASSSIHITKVYYNSPGSDTGSNTSLNAEYVRLKNVTSTSKRLTNWTVRDKSNHVYTFGTYYLAAGDSVYLHTGKGTNTAHHKYWQRSWYVWNNTGDTAYLKDSYGTTKDTCTWGSSGSYTYC
jgi:hypothetical protein